MKETISGVRQNVEVSKIERLNEIAHLPKSMGASQDESENIQSRFNSGEQHKVR